MKPKPKPQMFDLGSNRLNMGLTLLGLLRQPLNSSKSKVQVFSLRLIRKRQYKTPDTDGAF